ncbi:hypothetical protein HU230_0012530 [Bradyrhizobium quebecense]|uniref:Uncharacterized protein n=1 Tax=Bradyrhizobium quebecense TaxID=2748629 RepID=A0A974ACX2_9BRAD|nr:hypothetical protein [Bradyrhizobium quebecense]UGA46815.1 hypothetical protein HU230_0012530 [Bradyrhizobium quebecense]
MDKDEVASGIERCARSLHLLVTELSAAGRMDHEKAMRLALIGSDLFLYAWQVRKAQ